MMVDKYKTHLFSYRFDDARWSFEVKAKDAEEAKARLRALAWATYDGELVANIPDGEFVANISVGLSRFVRLVDWLRGARKSSPTKTWD